MPRRREADHIHHDRWLVSYADFITLLFAFFVVMYSISQVNESQYRVLSETLVSAFNTRIDSTTAARAINPIQVGEPTQAVKPSAIDLRHQDETGDGKMAGNGAFQERAELPQLLKQLTEDLQDLIGDNSISVQSNEMWLEVAINSEILFDSADDRLSYEAETIFADIAATLRPYNNPIQVEGYTDNVPISTKRFPSNWALSSARAVAVVELLIAEGVSPERLSAVGYGEYQPIDDNTTAEGRARNRRVALMVSRERVERPKVESPQAVEQLNNLERSAPNELLQPLDEVPETETNVAPDFEPTNGNELPSVNPSSAPASLAPSDRLAPIGNIKPVETEQGGLLFSSEPSR